MLYLALLLNVCNFNADYLLALFLECLKLALHSFECTHLCPLQSALWTKKEKETRIMSLKLILSCWDLSRVHEVTAKLLLVLTGLRSLYKGNMLTA